MSVQLFVLSAILTTVFPACHVSRSAIALKGYTTKSFRSRDSFECFQKCKQEANCQSLNYHIIGSLCELNNRTIAQKPWQSAFAENTTYFENPYKASLGSTASAAAISCQEIKNTSSTALDGFYWILNEKTNTPTREYCQIKMREMNSCLSISQENNAGVFMLNHGVDSFQAYCSLGRWTLIARFSNTDAKNWMRDDAYWWYDVTTAQGDTTNPSANLDMISPAFWSVNGSEIKITRSDDPTHAALLRTTSNCLRSGTFREKISNYGIFKQLTSWSNDQCLGSCAVIYGGQYKRTDGFNQSLCSGSIQSSDKIGFWCDHGAGDGAVMMIGGGGSVCSRADHGIGITEDNFARFNGNYDECDFGSELQGFSAYCSPSYALNLWIK